MEHPSFLLSSTESEGKATGTSFLVLEDLRISSQMLSPGISHPSDTVHILGIRTWAIPSE